MESIISWNLKGFGQLTVFEDFWRKWASPKTIQTHNQSLTLRPIHNQLDSKKAQKKNMILQNSQAILRHIVSIVSAVSLRSIISNDGRKRRRLRRQSRRLFQMRKHRMHSVLDYQSQCQQYTKYSTQASILFSFLSSIIPPPFVHPSIILSISHSPWAWACHC